MGGQLDRPPVGRPPARAAGRFGVDVVPLVVGAELLAAVAAAELLNLGLWSSVLLVVVVLLVGYTTGSYRPRIAPSVLDDVPGVAVRALVAGALVIALRSLAEVSVTDGPVLAAAAFLAFTLLGRAVAYWLVRRLRMSGHHEQPTLIIGCGQVGNQLARTLAEHREYGLAPVGFVDDHPLVDSPDRAVPLLGGVRSLPEILRQHAVSNVIVAFSSRSEAETVDLLRTCDRMSCEIFLVPRLFELHSSGGDVELVWGVPLARLRRGAFRTVGWKVKRVFDAVVAGVSLVVLSPLLAMIALAVRVEGGRGVIFKQQRVGLDGRPFTILKFRTFAPRQSNEEQTAWNIAADPGLRRLGRLLRRTSLDELPQLWNVVRGDMSLVGPRPERPLFVDEFTQRFPRYMARHRVPAGMTGWAQVNGLRGDTDISDRARFDNYYIENWSIWQDIKIVALTIAQILGGRGR